MKQFFSMPEVVADIGVPYHRVYYACLSGVVVPLRSGRSRLFTHSDVLTLRKHFDGLPQYVNRRPIPEVSCRTSENTGASPKGSCGN